MSEYDNFLDPVCRMLIRKPAEKDLQLLTASYENKTYNFCLQFCTSAFLTESNKYLLDQFTKKMDENSINGNNL